MKPYLLLLSALTLLIFAGCENQLEVSPEVSVNTKNALELLPSDAVMVGMVNPTRMNENPYLREMQEKAFSLQDVSDEMDANVQDFLDATGFDPLTDVKELYLSVGKDEQATFAVYANIRADKFEEFAVQHMGDDLEKTSYNGITIFGSDDFYVAFANDELMVGASSRPGIESTLDRLASDSPGLAADEKVNDLVRKVKTTASWFVAKDIKAAGISSESNSDAEMDVLLHAISSAAFGIDAERDGIAVRAILTPAESTTASDVASLTKGALAGMRGAAKNDEHAFRMLDDVEVRRSNGVVSVESFVPNAYLEQTRGD